MNSKSTSSNFDYKSEQKNVQFVRIKLYNSDNYFAGSNNNKVLADWVSGDFERIELQVKLSKRKVLDNVISIFLTEKKINERVIEELKTYALKRITILLTDSCNNVLVFDNLRLSEAFANYQESAFAAFKIDFSKVSKKLKNNFIKQEKITGISVSCELENNQPGSAQNYNDSTPGLQNAKIVTVVECSI